jgi:membrane associated rhomboid family serine protease
MTSSSATNPQVQLFYPHPAPCVTALAIINSTIFTITYYVLHDASWVYEMFSLRPDSRERILLQPWRLITYQFIHLYPMHVFLNVFAILHAGPLIERLLGKTRFLLFYFLASGLAAFMYELMLIAGGNLMPMRACGASGCVYALLGAVLALYPRMHVTLIKTLYIPYWLVFLAILLLDNHQLRGWRNAGCIIHLVASCAGWLSAKLLFNKPKLTESAA